MNRLRALYRAVFGRRPQVRVIRLTPEQYLRSRGFGAGTVRIADD